MHNLLFVAIAYLVILLAMYLMQRRLLYFPDNNRPSAQQLRHYGLQFWPADDTSYQGLIGIETQHQAKGTIVVFHGNAGAAWHRDYYVRALTPLGYRVVLAEFPGYGGRPGAHSEALFVEDARETVQQVYNAFGGPLFLWGESLGCGIAAAVAANPPVPIEAVILLTPWDSLSALAQTLYWYIPARWLLHDTYDNLNHLQSFNGPIAVQIAGNDEIIPKRHSMRLYESLQSPKKLWEFKGAGHNSWPVSPRELWWREVMEFVTGSGQADESK